MQNTWSQQGPLVNAHGGRAARGARRFLGVKNQNSKSKAPQTRFGLDLYLFEFVSWRYRGRS